MMQVPAKKGLATGLIIVLTSITPIFLATGVVVLTLAEYLSRK